MTLPTYNDRMGDWYEAIAHSRPCDFAVGPTGDPYMLRWFLTPRDDDTGGLYLHKFLKDDEDRAMHDHPWFSDSLCLSGKLREHYLFDADDITSVHTRIITPGDRIRRAPTFMHRLEVLEPGFTLFMRGPKVREWGFLCKEGWRHWTRFVDVNDAGASGIGCGEYGDPAVEATPRPRIIGVDLADGPDMQSVFTQPARRVD